MSKRWSVRQKTSTYVLLENDEDTTFQLYCPLNKGEWKATTAYAGVFDTYQSAEKFAYKLLQTARTAHLLNILSRKKGC